MVLAKVNEIQYMHFTVFDTDGITPLTGQAGACTSSLRKNGGTTAEVVTIAEIGVTGRYYASYTPLAVADYDMEVTCPDDRVMGENWETEINDLDDLATDIATVDGKADTIITDVGAVQTTVDSIETKIDIIDPIIDQIQLDTTQLLLDTISIESKIDLIQTDITTIDGKIDVIDGEVGVIDGKVDLIQIDTTAILVDTAQIIVDIAAVKAETALIYADTTQLLLDTIQILADIATVDGKVDNIYIDTQSLIGDMITVLADLTTIDGKCDTIISDIATMKTVVDAIKVDTTQIIADIGALPLITALDVWDELLAGIVTPLSIGVLLKTNVDALISSRAVPNEYDARMTAIQADLDDPDQYKADVSALATEANATANRIAVIAEIDANEVKIDTIITNIAALNNISVAQVWDYLLTAISTVGSIGKLIKDDLDQSLSATELNIRGADSDTLETLSDQIDGISIDADELTALMGKNSVYEHTFDLSHKHTGFIQYCYNSAANKVLNDHVTGLLYRFQFDVTYVSGDPTITGKVLL